MNDATVKKYAAAALQFARDRDEIDTLNRQLNTLQGAVRKDDRLLDLLRHPAIARSDKKDTLLRIVGEPSSAAIDALANVVLDNERPEVFVDIADVYQKLADEMRGVVRAHIDVAWRPDDDQIEEITAALSRLLDERVVVEVHTDPNIVGGARIRLPGRTIDASIDGRIQDIAEHISRSPVPQ